MIAIFEAIKGVAALIAIFGVLDLMSHDVRHLAIELIGHFKLNPDAHFPSVLLHYADILPGADLHSLVILASGYTALRLFEAYGLWDGRVWAEWLGSLSGGLYIPFEIRHVIHRPAVINGVVLAVNIFVVSYLIVRLWRRRSKQRGPGEQN